MTKGGILLGTNVREPDSEITLVIVRFSQIPAFDEQITEVRGKVVAKQRHIYSYVYHGNIIAIEYVCLC